MKKKDSMKKILPPVFALAVVISACGDNDKPPQDDNIDQDSLHVMENRQDQDNRNTTSYDSLPDKVTKDSTDSTGARPNQP